MKTWITVTSALAIAALAGCSASPETSAATPSDDDLGASAVITNTNADGTWTADARPPIQQYRSDVGGPTANIAANAYFQGPADKTRKMGVCLLQMGGQLACTGVPQPGETVQQAIDRECAFAPRRLATGGNRYCVAIDGTGQKYCAARQGTQAARCSGSPALTPPAAVSPGFFVTPYAPMDDGALYLSDACFEGCGVVDPSVSSGTSSACSAAPISGDYQACWDQNCDGSVERCMDWQGNIWMM